jgi:anti-sigma-K factor RskA
MRAQERHEDAAPFLLGSLNDLERQAFERHLMGCSDCQQDVERMRPAVEVQARDVEPMNPPPSLKAGLMAVVEREAAQRRAESAPARGSAFAWRRPALAAMAAATVAVVGVAGYEIGRSDQVEPRTYAAEVDRSRLAGASGRLIVSDGSGAVLRLSGLPDLPSSQAYAVWVRRAGEVTAVALVAPTGGGVASAGIDGELEGADAVLVTREPARNVRAPSEQPVISVPLTSS